MCVCVIVFMHVCANMSANDSAESNMAGHLRVQLYRAETERKAWASERDRLEDANRALQQRMADLLEVLAAHSGCVFVLLVAVSVHLSRLCSSYRLVVSVRRYWRNSCWFRLRS